MNQNKLFQNQFGKCLAWALCVSMAFSSSVFAEADYVQSPTGVFMPERPIADVIDELAASGYGMMEQNMNEGLEREALASRITKLSAVETSEESEANEEPEPVEEDVVEIVLAKNNSLTLTGSEKKAVIKLYMLVESMFQANAGVAKDTEDGELQKVPVRFEAGRTMSMSSASYDGAQISGSDVADENVLFNTDVAEDFKVFEKSNNFTDSLMDGIKRLRQLIKEEEINIPAGLEKLLDTALDFLEQFISVRLNRSIVAPISAETEEPMRLLDNPLVSAEALEMTLGAFDSQVYGEEASQEGDQEGGDSEKIVQPGQAQENLLHKLNKQRAKEDPRSYAQNAMAEKLKKKWVLTMLELLGLEDLIAAMDWSTGVRVGSNAFTMMSKTSRLGKDGRDRFSPAVFLIQTSTEAVKVELLKFREWLSRAREMDHKFLRNNVFLIRKIRKILSEPNNAVSEKQPEDEAIVASLELGDRSMALHVIHHMPKDMHPFLSILLDQKTDERRREYLLLVDNLHRMNDLAKGEKFNIRYKGEMLSHYLPLIDAEGKYELIAQA